jgi:hypothetical protein
MQKVQSFIHSHPRLSDLFFSFLGAFLVCFLTEASLSPLFSATTFGYTNVDSFFYLVTAKIWLQGGVPYKDFYDHKGLFHLCINVLGTCLGGRYGVWLLAILASAFNLYFLFSLVRFLSGDLWRWRLLAYGVYFVGFALLGEGNVEGEWILPFVTLWLYFYVHGIHEDNPRAFLWGSFFMGLVVGLSFNSRPLDAVWGGVGAVYYIIYWAKRKGGIALLWNVLIAIGGCLLPFAIFYPIAFAGGYLQDEIQALFVQSTHYLFRSQAGRFMTGSIYRLLDVAIIGFYILLSRLLKNAGKGSEPLTFFFLFSGILSAAIYLPLLQSLHYLQTSFTFCALYSVYALSLGVWPQLKRRWLVHGFAGLLGVFSLALVSYARISYYQDWPNGLSKKESEDIALFLDKNIPVEERKNGNVFAIDVESSVYLQLGCTPSERFFMYTDFWIYDNPQVIPEINDYLQTQKPKYLLYSVESPDVKAAFDEVIQKQYHHQDTTTFPISKPFSVYVLN